MPKGMTEFSKWLCKRLEERGIDLEDFADDIGISDRTVRKYIYEATIPRPDNMKKIREYFKGGD